MQVKGKAASISVWLLLSLVLLAVSFWVYRLTLMAPSEHSAHQAKQYISHITDTLHQTLFWTVQNPITEAMALPDDVDALLIAESGNVLAFRTRPDAGDKADQLLPSLLNVLKTGPLMTPVVAYWRQQVFLVVVSEKEGRKVVAATSLNRWLKKMNRDLSFRLSLATDSSQYRLQTLQAIHQWPSVLGGKVQLAAVSKMLNSAGSFPWYLSLGLCLALSGIIVWFFYYRPLWERIALYSEQTKAIMQSGDYKGRLQAEGRDELSMFVKQVNSVISSLEYCSNLMAKTNSLTTELMQKVDRSSLSSPDRPLSEEAELKASLDAVSRLSLALEKDNLEVYVQPVFGEDKTTIIGYEIMTRWLDEEIGLVPIMEFVAVCNQAGLLERLTEVMIKNAIKALQSLQDAQQTELWVSVPIGGAQFKEEHLVEVLTTLSDKERSLLSQVQFDIKESFITHDYEQAVVTIESIKRYGAGVCISDYGLSRYSLMYLQRIPVNSIKLSVTFAERLAWESREVAFIEGVARFAIGLGVRVMVCGLDSQDQLDSINSNLALAYQGVGLSAWVPLDVAVAS